VDVDELVTRELDEQVLPVGLGTLEHPTVEERRRLREAALRAAHADRAAAERVGEG
jgi:hypothetical protein